MGSVPKGSHKKHFPFSHPIFRSAWGDLLADMVKRTLQATGIAGIRAIVVHALSEEAKRFYEHFGFQSSPTDPLDVMMTLKGAQAHLV